MNMLSFELPEVIYKVIKYYDLSDVPEDFVDKVIELTEFYHFKDINLANEFSNNYFEEYENVELESITGAIFDFNLRVITTIDIINTLDLIPHIIDL